MATAIRGFIATRITEAPSLAGAAAGAIGIRAITVTIMAADLWEAPTRVATGLATSLAGVGPGTGAVAVIVAAEDMAEVTSDLDVAARAGIEDNPPWRLTSGER